MRETTMMRNAKYIAMALGVVMLLAGCSSKSPTAPKPTPIPALAISLTPETTSATAGDTVQVTARVTTGSGNAPDGTSVTFDVNGGTFPPSGATEAVRTTTGGGTSIGVTSSGGTATILGRVAGGSDQTSIKFAGVAPTPTPTGPPDYTPVIYALTPNAGPFEGGTRVTISGTGFQAPVQVLFDDIQAQVVSTTYTQIVCISPSITPTAPQSVVTASVTVTNIGNGKVSTGVDFRYGVTMFISSFTPMEGPADTPTTVTIFGQGFVAPVSVVTSGGVAWDVLSVAGTEVVVKTKPLDTAHVCDGGSTGFSVTNINTNQKADSPGSFAFRGVHPLITSVQVSPTSTNLIGEPGAGCETGSGVAHDSWAHTVTIKGTGFQSGNMMVSVGGVGGILPYVQDANTMTFTLPDLSSIPLNTAPCATGSRNVATPVDVTVTNFRYSGCADTLPGGIVIIPCDTTTCAAGPTPTPTPAPPTPTPTPVPFTLTLSTSGAGSISTDPGFYTCPTNCTPAFAPGTNVNLSFSTTGTFVGWGDDCSTCGTNLTCQITMSADHVCSATFNP
jgi:hypothetical protein